MKKLLSVIVFLLMFFPNITYASEIDYDITNYYINADILTDGNMKVTEVIVLDGTFNGYIRKIKYTNELLQENNFANNSIYNASNLEIISVEAKKIENINFDSIDNIDFDTLIASKSANGGYLESSITNGKSYKMYYKSNNDKVAFKITYLLKDIVVAHQDVAEVYWTFIGEEYPDRIRDLKIKVTLPVSDNSSNFRVWAHGDLAGEINKYDNQYLLATIKNLDPNSSVDIRTTFDLSAVNSEYISKKTDKKALEEILKVEEERAEVANQQRKTMRIKYNVVMAFTIIWFVALIISWTYIYCKFDKEYKKTFVAKYNREFIDDYNVEVIDYLFHKGITPNAMSASIMNLIYKKNIKVEEIPNEKNKKEYTFYLLNENGITEAEKYLIDFLFTRVGKNQQFTTTELKKYAKSTKTCERFSTSYTTWKNKVIQDGKNQGFYENHIKPKIWGVIFFLISIFNNVIAGILNVINPFTFIAVFIGFIFMIYTLLFNKRTIKGNDHFAKWSAFKRFLEDFGSFEIKELPEIKLWERYMVYATLFGLAEKVSKSMNVKIKELEQSGIYVDTTPTFTDWYIFNSINNSVTKSINDNITAITAERAGSSSSSGSGFGGGFSSGGGFGGGGGGGHGF